MKKRNVIFFLIFFSKKIISSVQRKSVFLLLFSFSLINQGFGQFSVPDYNFTFYDSTKVINKFDFELKKAWQGGINSAQFFEIDLNFDNIMDLIVFERFGNIVKPYIKSIQNNAVQLNYQPELKKYFPKINNWLIIKDFDNDGKNDIFTYESGGIKVYKNTSTNEKLSFQLFSEMLLTLQFNNYVNIFVTDADMPAIEDVDNDGDLDVLTFFGIGSFVEWHKNMSFEKYGNTDSLTFELVDHCWGKFKESENSNVVQLNVNCDKSKTAINNNNNNSKHTGSTLFLKDLNNDNLKDLLLSDFDFPGIVALYNGGTNSNALITSQDTNYPSFSNKINLFSMPALFWMNADADTVKDLVVSPFQPSLNVSENKESVWLYKNIGTNTFPQLQLVQKDFMQEEMIDVGSGAYPVLFDFNNDGLQDLFVANYGVYDTSIYNQGYLNTTFISKICLYQNIGSKDTAKFKEITDDFANVSQYKWLSVYPAFGDIDNDGDIDMFVGEANGNIHYFENISQQANIMNLQLKTLNYQSINIGKFSTPQLTDLNEDGLLDLIIGEKAGNINYYKNIGNTNIPNFQLITDTLGGVNVKIPEESNFGYSIPCFFKNKTNEWNLFVASESGNINYYNNITNNLSGKFTLKESKLSNIYEGIRTGICVGELTNDNYMDIIIGNYNGGLSFYKGKKPELIFINENKEILLNCKVFPNPTKDYITLNIESTNEINYKVQILDLNGSILIEIPINKSIERMDLSDLKNGVYFLQIKSNNGHIFKVKKIILIH